MVVKVGGKGKLKITNTSVADPLSIAHVILYRFLETLSGVFV